VLFIPNSFGQNTISNDSAILVLKGMFDSLYSVKSVQFEMFSRERMKGELIKSHSKGVVNFEPRKIFIRGFDEESVLLNEVLYVYGQNNNNALISSNGFPYINLNLDPEGSTMRRNRHFTIFEAGGRYLVDMLRLGMIKYNELGNMTDRFQISKNSESTYEVVITNDDYQYTTYTVKEGDNSRTIAKTLGIPEYKIVELNDEVSGFDDLDVGQLLIIPNLFAKRVELILRTNDLIPVQVRIFDDKGLYSEYIYTQYNTKAVVNNKTFNSNNPAYTF
jgi:hypothetical protein